jgi:hypothetical protein
MLFRRRRHPVTDEELSAYLDGQLDDAARARVEAHGADCARCREVLTELRLVRRALRALPRGQAPRSFALREADVRAPEARPAGGPLVRAAPALGGVAMVAFLSFWALVGLDVATQADRGAPSAALAPGGPAFDAGGEAPAAEDADAGRGEQDILSAGDGFQEGPPLPETGDESSLDGGDRLSSSPEAPAATSTPVEETAREAGGGGADRTGLRAAQAATAAVAVVAGGSLAAVLWRRRA